MVRGLAGKFINSARNTRAVQSVESGAKYVGKGARFAHEHQGKLGMAGVLGMGAISVPMNMNAGDSMSTAVVRAGAETALWAVAPWAMTAYEAATMGPALIDAGHEWHRNQQTNWNMKNQRSSIVGGNYQDTQRAATMRQASIEAISGSKMNARSALGGEAKILSQGWR